MHLTTCGEIPKTEVNFDINTEIYLNDEASLFKKLLEIKDNTLYENKKIIDDYCLNYLNSSPDNHIDAELKKIIMREFQKCENMYPYMGNLFLEILFKNKKNKRNLKFKYKKNFQNEFINSLKNLQVKQISEIFLSHMTLEYFVDVKKEKTDQVIILKKDNLNFDIEFDNSYYSGNDLVLDEYNFVIIDGVIDTMGDIHHLLYEASRNKESYVIFCYGVSEEVKHTIITNNKRNITKVFPIDIKVCEESLNILNDIAVIHNDDVVSALKGQTISQAVSKKLQKGKNIIIKNNSFVVEKKCKEYDLSNHKKILKHRIENSINDTNKSYLEKRYKRLNSKTASIIVPEVLFNEVNFTRELDYFLRFISHLDKKMLRIKNVSGKNYYYIPESYYNALLVIVSNIRIIFKKINISITKVRG